MEADARTAARALGVHAKTIRKWCREQGAPVVDHGPPLIVDPEALRRWRAGNRDDQMTEIANALLNTFQRDAGDGKPAHRLFHIQDGPAAALLLAAWDRVHLDITGKASAPPFPESVRRLRATVGLEPEPTSEPLELADDFFSDFPGLAKLAPDRYRKPPRQPDSLWHPKREP